MTGKYKVGSGLNAYWEYRLCARHNTVGAVSNCVDRTCALKTDGNTDAIC